MAKVQRGDPENRSEQHSGKMMSDLSEDEVPEEVSFNESKAVAFKRVKDAQDSVKRGKELVKEKRRKRQLLFQEQKKNRLLPDALLEQLCTVEEQPATAHNEKGKQEEEEIIVKKPKKVCKSLQGSCMVMRVKDSAADTSRRKSAMDFIQARLYGSGSQRTTNAELLSLQKKRGPQQGAAVQFVNKKWGAQQKAKAEKCNKRFIHRQKLLST